MKQLYLTNTLTSTKQAFIPISKQVRMYVCGPTVYGPIHIGNARSLVVYDLLYRLLIDIYGFANVQYVRNITDVDDKIHLRAKELNITIDELTQTTIAQFFSDAKYLGCMEPSIQPRATEHIAQMIDMITKLIEQNCAYITKTGVYFSVASCKDYAKISGRTLEDLLPGNRIEYDYSKQNIHDFVLWKFAANAGDLISDFPSPWGAGQPGWHIECSAMANYYLGTDFDIHGGGIDLIFPHHTNEIAQSCCAFPGSGFAKYWVHNGFLKAEGQKMSKSLGNFVTVADIKNKNIHTSVIRYTLLNTHYHKPLDFSKQSLLEAEENVKYLNRVTQNCSSIAGQPSDEFFSYLLDDLNTHAAFAYLLKIAKIANKTGDVSLKQNIRYCCEFIGILEQQKVNSIDPNYIQKMINERAVAKAANNWQLADRIRDDLTSQGIILQDHKSQPTTWHKQ